MQMTQYWERMLFGRDIVFAVGSKNSNKNLRGLIQASAQPPLEDVCFAIAGGSNGNVFADARTRGEWH